MTSPLPSIDEAHAAQFDRALKERGGAIGAALADLEIEDVPVELHVTWEAMLKGVEYLRYLEREVDRWMGPHRLRREREERAATEAKRDLAAAGNSIAPWTADEVASLNAYQASGAMHPFTCENDDANYCASVLVATSAGWTCPDCDYTQNWATAWMANWAWRVALETGIGAWVPGCVAYDPYAEIPSRIRVEVDDRIRPGMVVAVAENVGALDLEAGEIAVVERDGEDAARYSNAVNAPLADATIAALNQALSSGDYPRYKRRKTDAPSGGSDA